MPTLNDPTLVATSDYYPFVTMLADRIEDVLAHTTKGDFFVKRVDTQPLIANQNVKITITHRSGLTMKESEENMIRLLTRYLYEQLLKHYRDCKNVENINIDIALEKRQDSNKEEVPLFTIEGQNPSLVYNDNTTTIENELRFSFVVGYNPLHKKWRLHTFINEHIEDYNKWFKNYPIDFATAKLISEAKQLTDLPESSPW